MNCCDKPKITDWSAGYASAAGRTNKMCQTCGAHLFGTGDDVRFFTKREWDSWISEECAASQTEQKPEAQNCGLCIHFLKDGMYGSTPIGTCTHDPHAYELKRGDEGRLCAAFESPNVRVEGRGVTNPEAEIHASTASLSNDRLERISEKDK